MAYIISAVILLCCILGVFLYFQNNWISVKRVKFKSSKLPEAFHGFRMICLSDLHNKCFFPHQKPIFDVLQLERPDAILFCGDLIDGRTSSNNMQNAITLMQGCLKYAPVYYVSGNNEAKNPHFDTLILRLQNLGVYILRNNKFTLSRHGSKLTLLGLDDMDFYSGRKKAERIFVLRQALNALSASTSGFKILLSHRPELIDLYNQSNIQVVLSGHAHGGQFRLPGVGGLFAPGQGLFPKYTAGLHHFSHFSLAITRGLGNSSFPFRLFNRPEILVLTLHTEKQEVSS